MAFLKSSHILNFCDCTFHYVISLVSCSLLTDPSNGVINCSLGDDRVPSYEDTCSYTCNTGYKLTGSDTRTCQSDASWSGSDGVCNRGEKFLCVCNAVITMESALYVHMLLTVLIEYLSICQFYLAYIPT